MRTPEKWIPREGLRRGWTETCAAGKLVRKTAGWGQLPLCLPAVICGPSLIPKWRQLCQWWFFDGGLRFRPHSGLSSEGHCPVRSVWSHIPVGLLSPKAIGWGHREKGRATLSRQGAAAVVHAGDIPFVAT